MPADPNSFEALRPRLSAQTLRDIEGLDPAKFGFEREECCGAVPLKLPGSMDMNKEHIFLMTPVSANDWDKRTENVPGFSALHQNLIKSVEGCSVTVGAQPGTPGDAYVLRFRLADGRLQATQYSCAELGAIPWMTRGTLAVDRSEDTFIFICAHRSRDERCGYCGHVLADLFTQAVAKAMPPEAACRVHVVLCSHLGGHIYAGNVVVYSRWGGVGFGLFKPVDVDAVVASLVEGEGKVPESLKDRIRGEMTGIGVAQRSGCETM